MPEERRNNMETEKNVTAETKEMTAELEESKKPGKNKKEKPKKTVKEEIMSWIWTLLAAIVIATLFRAFIAEPIKVDGNSMTNTLMNGEIMLVSKLDYRFGEMERGDVVVCRYPGRTLGSFNLGASLSVDTHVLFVKRLVGLPGDTLWIANGKLYVNGEEVTDPEKMASKPRDMMPITLGRDEYFVVGDNRYSSHDSRASDVGPISANAIMGKVKCVLFPFNAIRGIE